MTTRATGVSVNKAWSITPTRIICIPKLWLYWVVSCLTSVPSVFAVSARRYCDGTLCGFQLHKALSNIQVPLYCSQLYTIQTNRHTEYCAIQTGFNWITAYIIRLPGKSTAEGIRQRQPVSSQWAGWGTSISGRFSRRPVSWQGDGSCYILCTTHCCCKLLSL